LAKLKLNFKSDKMNMFHNNTITFYQSFRIQNLSVCGRKYCICKNNYSKMRFTAKTIILSIFIISTGRNLFAQKSEKVVIEKLTSKDKGKIAKADKWLVKGNGILKEASVYDDKAAAMKEAKGKIKMGKINKLEKKSDGLKIKAASYLQDGYKKKAKVFGSVIKDSRKTNPQLASRLKEVEFTSDKKIKKSKKLYRKADDMGSKSKAVEYFELGHKNYVEAIDILCDGLAVVYNMESLNEQENITAEENEVAKDKGETEAQQSVAENSEADLTGNTANSAGVNGAVAGGVAVAGATAAVVTTGNDKDENKETDMAEAGHAETEAVVAEQAIAADTIPQSVTPEEKKDIDTFFTIQFIADKKPVSQEVLKTKYAGTQEVVEMSAGGWYRYSAGKFTKLDEAKAVMKAEGIKGFIVAYKSGERITVSEAVELLK
jgi:hypothetical protein